MHNSPESYGIEPLKTPLNPFSHSRTISSTVCAFFHELPCWSISTFTQAMQPNGTYLRNLRKPPLEVCAVASLRLIIHHTGLRATSPSTHPAHAQGTNRSSVCEVCLACLTANSFSTVAIVASLACSRRTWAGRRNLNAAIAGGPAIL